MRLTSAVFVLLAMQVGCGGIKVPGLQIGGSEASAGGLGGGGGEEGERTLKLYQELTYANVSASSADAIFNKAGIPTGYNPRNKTDNPDPKWITGWDGLQLTDETKTAIAQAAINRSWTTACHKEFDAYHAAWKKIAAARRPELEKLHKPGNYYDRAAGLAALLETVTREAESAKVLYKPGSPVAGVGFLDDIVQAMAKLHRETKREFIAPTYFAKHPISAAVPAESGRPFAEAGDERDIFCAAAQKSGAGSLPALPVLEEYGNGFKAIRWPVAQDRKGALAEKREALVAASRAARAFGDATAASLTSGSLPGKTEPKLYHVYAEEGQVGADRDSPFKVTSVTKSGAATVVEVENTRERQVPYDCKSTSQIERIENGTIFYVKDCKYQTQVTTRAVTVEFAELPSSLEIKAGDFIGFYGDLLEKNEPKGQGTKDKLTTRVTFRFAGRYLEVLKRDKLVLKAF